MNFEEFRATRMWCDDLRASIRDSRWDVAYGPMPELPAGFVYDDTLFIERVMGWWPAEARERGQWCLMIERDDMISDDLQSLERKLYEWAKSAGYWDRKAFDPVGDLTREFPRFDPASLPAIPAGFWPTHWRNDSQPTWHEKPSRPEPGSLMLAIDFEADADRECPGDFRFNLMIYPGDCSPEPLFGSDDWEEIEIVIRLVRYVRMFGLGFHPDTPGDQYVVGEAGTRCFSEAEAEAYDSDLDAAVDRLGDVYEITVVVWRALGLIEHV